MDKKVINLNDYKEEKNKQLINGNLALDTKENSEEPKILKLVIGKSKNKMFCGCWEVANGEDFC